MHWQHVLAGIGLILQSQAQAQLLMPQMPFSIQGNHSYSTESLIPSQSMQLVSVYHHGSAHGPNPGLFRRLDISKYDLWAQDEGYTIQPTIELISRPSFHSTQQLRSLQADRRKVRWASISSSPMELESAWDLVPDVKDRPSILSLAMMANNAYSNVDNSTDWYDLGSPWQLNTSFGWESDGIRGHVFGNEDHSLMIISFKGTSAGLFSGGPTGEKDKINDNMLFSCCCAYISRAWSPVCDCYNGHEYQCESQCLERNILKSELYYDNALEIYKDVSERYPDAAIWLAGHSLGGAIASLVGQTFGIPTVTFESPGDRLAAIRLHLPHGPAVEHMPLWHFGHTADPIFVGVCTGPTSSCWYGGFAMESRCHTGKVCVWDTVRDKGWRVDIRSHRIRDLIENILKNTKDFPLLPDCVLEDVECTDCGLWEYFDQRDRTTQISSTLSGTSSSSGTSQPTPPDDPWLTRGCAR